MISSALAAGSTRFSFLRVHDASPRKPLAIALTAALLVAAGARANAQSAEQASPWWSIWDPRTSPFIPIPEVGTDPNSGTTVGLLPVFLSTDEQDHIRRIIAPDIIYNPDLGAGARFRIFEYPSEDEQWYAVAGLKERIERELDLSYAKGLLRQDHWSYGTRLVYDRSATRRFFGIGNDSLSRDETNYTAEQASLSLFVGRNVTPAVQLGFELRPRVFEVERGALSGVPSTTEKFAAVPGVGSENEVLYRLFLTYDTRDAINLPTRGTQITGLAGIADRALLSSVSYSVFGIDARHFEPLSSGVVLAAHAALRYTAAASNTPFWALASLGGDRSVLGERQPLRGFGEDRFIDRNLFAANVELRSSVLDLRLFSTDLSLEVAPFIDFGRVFHDAADNPARALHVAGGVGFRAVAHPFLVGYVDVGFGGEGAAIFSGINYAF